MPGFFVKSNFFCLFKTGDNVNYNLEILKCFYEIYNKTNDSEKLVLIKPIIVWLVSIVEAILHDFHKRIRANIHEGIINMSQGVIDYVRNKKIDELEKYINSAKKHDFFDLKDTNFYIKLDDLRKIRNRIHIQNNKFLKPRDERTIFDEKVKVLAEKCTEKVVKTISEKHPRPKNLKDYVSDMYFPWNEYFPKK